MAPATGYRLKPPPFTRSEKYFVLFFASFTAPNQWLRQLKLPPTGSDAISDSHRKAPPYVRGLSVAPAAGLEPAA